MPGHGVHAEAIVGGRKHRANSSDQRQNLRPPMFGAGGFVLLAVADDGVELVVDVETA
jgi:hypothetical protein